MTKKPTAKPSQPAKAAPAVPRHEEVDTLLRQHVKRIELGFFEFLELADEAISGKYHEKWGYVDAGPYFEERIGVGYRSLCRRLAVLEGLRALPPAEMPHAKEVLAELGAHRASILAPAFKQEPGDWREWVELAHGSTEDALQEAVSSALGLRPRGKAGAPGERFLGYMLNAVPPDRREQVAWVFQEMAKIGGDPGNKWSPLAVFLQLVNFGETELAGHNVFRTGRS